VCVQQDYHSAAGMKCTIHYGCESLNFCTALRINKYIVQKCMHTVENVCILHIQQIYTLQVHMSASGIVLHYIW